MREFKIVTYIEDDNKKREHIAIGEMSVYPFSDIEGYWKSLHEMFGKEEISDDLDYFIKYMNDNNCEFFKESLKDKSIKTREITKEDMGKHNRELYEFYKKYDLDKEKCKWEGFKAEEV